MYTHETFFKECFAPFRKEQHLIWHGFSIVRDREFIHFLLLKGEQSSSKLRQFPPPSWRGYPRNWWLSISWVQLYWLYYEPSEIIEVLVSGDSTVLPPMLIIYIVPPKEGLADLTSKQCLSFVALSMFICRYSSLMLPLSKVGLEYLCGFWWTERKSNTGTIIHEWFVLREFSSYSHKIHVPSAKWEFKLPYLVNAIWSCLPICYIFYWKFLCIPYTQKNKYGK